jgi:V8-like Glu-specific endopeptidase
VFRPVYAGTAFLIAPDRLMTNNHVFVGDEQRAATAADAGATATFNYEQDINGKLAPIKQYATAPDQYFAADLELDVAVVAVTGNPGDEFGTLALPSPDVTVSVGDDVFIIQHPNGGPKQIAMAGNEVAYVDDKIVQYTTDTLKGSSGSPVFDWQWRLVALHHAGGDLVEPASGRTYFRNEGIRLSAIVPALRLAK